MSKAIKVIDLLNKIANGEEIPKKIKVKDYIFIWEVSDNGTGYSNVKEDTGYYWFENYVSLDNSEDLNTEIEIIEEEPEIDIQSYKELLLDQLREREHTNADIYMLGVQINALIRAVKQLDNQINNK